VLNFSPNDPEILHIDLNSCFASIEQQANPFLRNKPIAVAAYDSPGGCIVAPSVEAKKLGIKVGMRVKEGKLLCRDLVVLPPDPDKYRDVYLRFKKLLSDYGEPVPKSIDEFVLKMDQPLKYALEIKQRIKSEIGDWLRVSIGIGPNRFLAKTAAGLHKPDGLDVIDKNNFLEIYRDLKLMDLCGIKKANCIRLNLAGIYTVLDFYNATSERLQRAFASVVGHWWYQWLHGWEIEDHKQSRGSFGNSYALPKLLSMPEDLAPILTKLVEKTGQRMRGGGYYCRGVHVAVLYRDRKFWHHGETASEPIFDSRDIYKQAFRILCQSPYKSPVAILSESVFNLVPANVSQQSLFFDEGKKQSLVGSLDKINHKYGDFVVCPALMLGTENLAPDRIAFGGVRELGMLK